MHPETKLKRRGASSSKKFVSYIDFLMKVQEMSNHVLHFISACPEYNLFIAACLEIRKCTITFLWQNNGNPKSIVNLARAIFFSIQHMDF